MRTLPGGPATFNHHSCELEHLFEKAFGEVYQTRLIGGADEPYYLPAGETCIAPFFCKLLERNGEKAPVQRSFIFYREDYYASALHEIAHWCIAGEARRQQIDFGYWYQPDGRDISAQQKFMAVEIKPQALELLFSLAVDYPFLPSLDNLAMQQSSGESEHCPDMQAEKFFADIRLQALDYLDSGLPLRAARFIRLLGSAYSRDTSPQALRAQLLRLA